MTKRSLTTPRALAVVALTRINRQHAYSNLEVNQLLAQHPLTAPDRRLLTSLVYGTLQHRLTLQAWLAPRVHRRLDDWVQELLLVTLYQYHYLERVPNFAATNEAIEIAKTRGGAGVRKFVTGVLHAVLKTPFPDPTKLSDPVQRLSLAASLPEWLVRQLIEEYGLTQAEQVAASVNQPPHQSVRVNRAKTTPQAAIAALKEEGVTAKPSAVAGDGLVLEGGRLFETAAFKEGLVTVQDESAMLAAESMDLSAAQLVLDACSAPGGKTGQLAAALADHGGRVIALDIHAHKVRLVKQNLARLSLAGVVDTRQGDARKLDFLADASLDAALVDAPCSGLGLLRRKPEIRYQKQLADSHQLHQIQLAILNAVAPKIKKGGIMTYSTCTILKEENQETVAAFLASHPEFALEKTQTARAIKSDRAEKPLTILPSDFGSDGFFIATLKRID